MHAYGLLLRTWAGRVPRYNFLAGWDQLKVTEGGWLLEIPEAVKDYVGAFAHGDADGCASAFAPDGTYSDPGTAGPLSGQAIRDHFAAFFGGFPDAACETVSLIPVTRNLLVWRWILRGTNTASYRGIPATGRSMTLPGCEFIEVRGAKVHRVDGYFDRLAILAQLGLAPGPAAPAAG